MLENGWTKNFLQLNENKMQIKQRLSCLTPNLKFVKASAEALSSCVQPPRVKTNSGKDLQLYLLATLSTETLKYLLHPFLSHRFLITLNQHVLSIHSLIMHGRQRNTANLSPILSSSHSPFSLSMGLWNCQSAVNKLTSFQPLYLILLLKSWA